MTGPLSSSDTLPTALIDPSLLANKRCASLLNPTSPLPYLTLWYPFAVLSASVQLVAAQHLQASAAHIATTLGTTKVRYHTPCTPG